VGVAVPCGRRNSLSITCKAVQRSSSTDWTDTRVGYDSIRPTDDVRRRVTTARILLIDDYVDLLDMLKTYLEREEFAVTAIDVAVMGVAAALSADHDLAVLDVMMPNINGIEALRRIPLSSMIPVLMLTAKGEDADRIVGLELGADDYVPKPCTPRELVARIRAILRRLQPAAEAHAGEASLVSGGLTMWPHQRRAEWLG